MFTVVQLVLVDETGDSYYRMRWPAEELSAQEPSWRIINLDALSPDRFEWAARADLLVLYQCADPDLFPVLEQRRRAGLKTIVEYNDNFYQSPNWGPVAEAWRSPLLWQTYEHFMQLADTVIVTGPGLAELFSSMLDPKKIVILENHLHHSPRASPKVRSSQSDPFHLGWAGSLGHMVDLLAIVPQLRALTASNPNLHLHIMGNESIPQFMGLPPHQLSFTSWGSMQKYYEFWNPVQLGIVPLLDTAYNHCRSDIKAVEIAACGALPLLPDALPYKNFLSATKLRPYKEIREITERINEYFNNPELLEEQRLRVYEYVSRERHGPERRERLELYRKHLPSAAGDETWPVASGFHSIHGSGQKVAPSVALLDQARLLLKEKRVREAHQLLENAATQNPFHLDINLSLLRVKSLTRDVTLTSQLEFSKARFPRDLRVWLLELLSTHYEDRGARWHELVAKLRVEGETFARFFERDIIGVLMRVTEKLKDLQLLEELSTIFPNNVALKIRLAELYEQQGNDAAALELYTWLQTQLEIFKENQEDLKNLQEGYLSAWCETLLARERA